jgi:hypothetical protein
VPSASLDGTATPPMPEEMLTISQWAEQSGGIHPSIFTT